MADQAYQLIVRKGPRPGQLFPLTQETVTIGRDPASDIVLNDSEISRHHAQLRKIKDGYELNDLGSTNGSFVDGRRLTGEAEALAPGQVIMFGSNVTLIYQATSAADPLATMVSPVAAMPALEPKVEPEPEPLAAFEPEPESDPELEPEADLSDEMGTIVDASPSFGAPIEPEPEAEDVPETPIPAEVATDYIPHPAFGTPPMGSVGSSDALGELASPVGPTASFTTAEPAKPVPKSNGIGGLSRNTTIAVVVAVILLCCCCSLIALGWLYSSGEYQFDFGAAMPHELILFYARQMLA